MSYFFDNIKFFLKTSNNPSISSFFNRHHTNNFTVNGLFVSKDIVNNGFPEQYIFIPNSLSFLYQLSSLLHEIEHFNHCKKIGKNSYYKVRTRKKEFYVYSNVANKILYSNFNNSVKKQLLDNFISQIRLLCKSNFDIYKKAAKKMVKKRIWKKCLKFVKDDSLVLV